MTFLTKNQEKDKGKDKDKEKDKEREKGKEKDKDKEKKEKKKEEEEVEVEEEKTVFSICFSFLSFQLKNNQWLILFYFLGNSNGLPKGRCDVWLAPNECHECDSQRRTFF